jgi:two-component system, NarL family, sensor histidine kinase UhpB
MSSPLRTKIAIIAIGVFILAADLTVPADIDLGIFYCFVVILCVWIGNLSFLWAVCAASVLATVAGLVFAPPAGGISWVNWCNRALTIAAILLVSAFTHKRIRNGQLLNRTIAARRAAELALREGEQRLRMAQEAGHVGSWEWNPADEMYTMSDECYRILGLTPGEELFSRKWMAGIESEDLIKIRQAMIHCAVGDSFEAEYRYQHPSMGLRCIGVRGRMQQLESGEARLWGTFHDITEQKTAAEFMKQSQSILESLVEQRTVQLKNLSSALMRSQDEEHRRIARELHDSFGQYLAALKINLDRMLLFHQKLPASDSPDVKQMLTDSVNIVQQCIIESRTLSHLLHPPLLDEAGLASAARGYVEEFARRGQIDATLTFSCEIPPMEPSLDLALFRALQERLTNVYRYSGSPRVDVRIALDDKKITLEVQDYGRGIPLETMKRFSEDGSGVGVGLAAMRQRMEELGGTLVISSDLNGTKVQATAPILRRTDTDSHSHAA